jgi:serine/threonine-protein kinase
MVSSDEPNLYKLFKDHTPYELVQEIASGGMGKVFEAVRNGVEGFEKRVAIKTISQDLTDHQDFVNMFVGEAKLVADLVHINIVQIYNLGQIDDLYYISMEFVRGITLKDFIKQHLLDNRQIPYELSAFIVTRIAKALEYAHTKRDQNGNCLNVVHRDVCPKNIMISSEGVVKLTDFGIAKAQNLMLDKEGDVLMGKAPYMSPEQAQFDETDGRSDLFSLGVVFYELLTQDRLFDGPETDVILDRVMKEDIPPPRQEAGDIPERLEQIVMKLLNREPDERYQRAGKLAYDLERFMYDPGFGPTYEKLRDYITSMFPERFRWDQERKEVSSSNEGQDEADEEEKTDTETNMSKRTTLRSDDTIS